MESNQLARYPGRSFHFDYNNDVHANGMHTNGIHALFVKSLFLLHKSTAITKGPVSITTL